MSQIRERWPPQGLPAGHDLRNIITSDNGEYPPTAANLQEAIDDLTDAGHIWLPNHRLLPVAPVTIDKPLTLEGTHISTTMGTSTDWPEIDIGGFEGTVIEQQTAGENVIDITCIGRTVNLINLGLTWEGTIIDVNTGYGVDQYPPADNGNRDQGIFNSYWRNIFVHGHDSTHFGFRLCNFQHCLFESLKAYGSGIIECLNNSAATQFGNSSFINAFGTIYTAGLDGILASQVGEQMSNLVWYHPYVLSNVNLGGNFHYDWRLTSHWSMIGGNLENGPAGVAGGFANAASTMILPSGAAPGGTRMYKPLYFQTAAATNMEIIPAGYLIGNVNYQMRFTKFAAVPHIANGSNDIYLDDGTNTGDGASHLRYDDPDGGGAGVPAWVDL